MLIFNLLGSIGETRTKDAQSVARALLMVLIFATHEIS